MKIYEYRPLVNDNVNLATILCEMWYDIGDDVNQEYDERADINSDRFDPLALIKEKYKYNDTATTRISSVNRKDRSEVYFW